MRISIILFACFLSIPSTAQNWVNEGATSSFDIETQKNNSELSVNYCFVFREGNILNCMFDKEIIRLQKQSKDCYVTKKAISARMGEQFQLDICIDNTNLKWRIPNDNDIPYLPKKLDFKKSD